VLKNGFYHEQISMNLTVCIEYFYGGNTLITGHSVALINFFGSPAPRGNQRKKSTFEKKSHFGVGFRPTFFLQFVYICVLRNFASLDDDFFGVFCNIWILMISIGFSLIYLHSPGKMPTNYFICLGIKPADDPEAKPKVFKNTIFYIFSNEMAPHLK
jgi:hypothetical protein